jgi:hypothetical protein
MVDERENYFEINNIVELLFTTFVCPTCKLHCKSAHACNIESVAGRDLVHPIHPHGNLLDKVIRKDTDALLFLRQ